MSELKCVVGVTQLPDPLPKDAVVFQRNCGCYMIGQPGDRISEFVCEHGFFVAQTRTPPPPDGTIAIG